MSLVGVKEIFDKRPEQWTARETAFIVSEIGRLEAEKREARDRPAFHNCLIVDACGLEHEFNLARIGLRADPLPRGFLIPLRENAVGRFVQGEAALTPDPPPRTREFVLRRMRHWDGKPIYEERLP